MEAELTSGNLEKYTLFSERLGALVAQLHSTRGEHAVETSRMAGELKGAEYCVAELLQSDSSTISSVEGQLATKKAFLVELQAALGATRVRGCKEKTLNKELLEKASVLDMEASEAKKELVENTASVEKSEKEVKDLRGSMEADHKAMELIYRVEADDPKRDIKSLKDKLGAGESIAREKSDLEAEMKQLKVQVSSFEELTKPQESAIKIAIKGSKGLAATLKEQSGSTQALVEGEVALTNSQNESAVKMRVIEAELSFEFVIRTAAKGARRDGRPIIWDHEWHISKESKGIMSEIHRLCDELWENPLQEVWPDEFARPIWLQTPMLVKRLFRWNISKEPKAILSEIHRLCDELRENQLREVEPTEFAIPIWLQTPMLVKRLFR
ncbi:hypothetical protein B9Z19DRAFT_1126939 [Tuber borchii]|uniref:Uncharacterized protein n=1 Tax=Tuber borchii TaxID=42251 RepID=A0A2T6ZS99_TUBBO|nr:hypothetical protein B9Z19DRAFT_1126939 [Tuber borchii]